MYTYSRHRKILVNMKCSNRNSLLCHNSIQFTFVKLTLHKLCSDFTCISL